MLTLIPLCQDSRDGDEVLWDRPYQPLPPTPLPFPGYAQLRAISLETLLHPTGQASIESGISLLDIRGDLGGLHMTLPRIPRETQSTFLRTGLNRLAGEEAEGRF
ncbi:hypothetical protein SKAU_G00051500 [Synaphobranchus kaupii]|uniref:Uncharacterized protein n=1 Tax=Synaphobranchus kaupii TaxID=118154 RepID=A0A9Q1G4I0_SYNKA|nr:hypothetical protein SKAU_G00051500 [Synaphobranchus kaupii]